MGERRDRDYLQHLRGLCQKSSANSSEAPRRRPRRAFNGNMVHSHRQMDDVETERATYVSLNHHNCISDERCFLGGLQRIFGFFNGHPSRRFKWRVPQQAPRDETAPKVIAA